jgi:multicomponent Na+:H+ antiporter subunit C
MADIFSHMHYDIAIFLMMTGLYIGISSGNLVKKLMGIGLFQTSVLLIYIASGWHAGAHPPILDEHAPAYVSPLPQVLMLTAIVVGVATLAVGLALILRIHGAYGSLDETQIRAADEEQAAKDASA